MNRSPSPGVQQSGKRAEFLHRKHRAGFHVFAKHVVAQAAPMPRRLTIATLPLTRSGRAAATLVGQDLNAPEDGLSAASRHFGDTLHWGCGRRTLGGEDQRALRLSSALRQDSRRIFLAGLRSKIPMPPRRCRW
jgi:hypothetical protein